jgi:DNA-binding NarL/FixJ family response regulator
VKGTSGAARVAVLADDLIWATRLAEHLRTAGASPVPCRTSAQLEAALAAATPEASVDAVVIDLTARAYDGIEAVRSAASTGRPVLAVGQHDDHELRRRAIEAGAGKVFAYRRLADDGATVLALWLASAGGPDIVRHADPAPEAPARTAR